MDQIYYHGRFHTLCGPDMEAIAVKDGKIAALGSTKELLPLAGPHTLLVDLEGNSVLPGFIDSHCHLLATGQADEQLDLHGCRSVQEMIERGREFIRSRCLPAGAWVVGGGYDHNLFDPPILPDGAVAQAISSEHPVMFERVCGHVGAANPLALSLAGFGPETEIEGGELDRDEAGCLTGVLREAALDRFKQFIPPPDQAMLTRALTAGIRTANQGGVTSVHSDDLVSVPMEAFLEAVKTLRDQGQFHIRVWEEVEAARLPLLEKLLDQGQRTGDGDCWYRMGNLKLLLDGSLGARTAYLRRPYEDDPGNQGIRVYEQQDLDQLVLLAHRSGLQVAFHAIGDGAVEQAVTAVERAQRICPKDLCHRIVHCQIADRALFRRMAACGLGADIQPAFTSSDWPLVRSRLAGVVVV